MRNMQTRTPRGNRSGYSKPQYRKPQYSEEESLKRSHSVVSNLKLTLIALCTALFFAGVSLVRLVFGKEQLFVFRRRRNKRRSCRVVWQYAGAF